MTRRVPAKLSMDMESVAFAVTANSWISIFGNAPCNATPKNASETIEGVYHKPEKSRLVADETLRHIFWIQDYMKYPHTNILGLLRVAYSDVFGNCYYQDIKFCYDKAVLQKDKIMEFDSIKAPVLKDDALPLFKLLKNEYPEHLNNKTK